MRLIGLVGAKQSGKTSVSNLLVDEYGFVRMRFADGLKTMLRALGLNDAQLEGSDKEVPSDLLGGLTPRRAMQTLGTEWGRDLIHPDLWRNVVWGAVKQAHHANPNVRIVIDDCRFPNEYAMVRALHGEVWRVRRPSVETKLSPFTEFLVRRGWSNAVHPSELYWPKFASTYDIPNTRSLAHLRRHARGLVERVPVL